MKDFGIYQHSEALMGGYGYSYGYAYGSCIVTWVFDTNSNNFAQWILERRSWICIGMLFGALWERIRVLEIFYIILCVACKQGWTMA